MSEEVKTEEEPSIEEILDSIRQIISEDDDDEEEVDAVASAEEDVAEVEAQDEPEPKPEAEAEPMDQSAIDDMDFDAPVADEPAEAKMEGESEPEPEAEAEPDPAEEEDVLELTELVDSEGNNIDIDMVEGDEAEEELASEDEPASEPEPEPEPAPETDPEPSSVEPEPVAESGDDGDSLLTAAAENAVKSAVSNLVRKTAVGSGGLTLEDIVRAELKPLLRSWLDKHLPTVIERLVKEELERVSKRVLDE